MPSSRRFSYTSRSVHFHSQAMALSEKPFRLAFRKMVSSQGRALISPS